MIFTPLDMAAAIVLLVGWLGYPWIRQIFRRDDLTERVAAARHAWMRQMLRRDDRITDVSLARGLVQSVAFLASTSVLLISGAIGLFGSAGFIAEIVNQSPWLAPTTRAAFEIKTGVLLLIFVQTFFRLTWAMRLHSYSLILIGAAPPPEEHTTAKALEIAKKSANLSTLASRHYLAGLRGYYFGLAALTWYVHPLLLVGAVLFTYLVLIRRDYFSNASSLLDGPSEDNRASKPDG